MLLRKILLASAATSLGLSAPAAACDQHGPGQSGGFHRYNPFANALGTIQSRAEQFAQSDYVRGDDSKKVKVERIKREKAIDVEAEAQKARKADLREKDQQGRGAPR